MQEKVLAIDPGIYGAFVITDGRKYIQCYPMPVEINGKDKSIPFGAVDKLLGLVKSEHGEDIHVFLERAVSFGMGTKSAFNYGRGFEAITVAIGIHDLALTLVEPGKWAKEMHEGISSTMKAKAKSVIAVNRLYPTLVRSMPSVNAKYREGIFDALLIAGYALRKLRGTQRVGLPLTNPVQGNVVEKKGIKRKPSKRKVKPVIPEGDDFY